jgi:uncharacterized lipoprotein YddW (UPF0748 family)
MAPLARTIAAGDHRVVAPAAEVRALWVVRDSIATPSAIPPIVQRAVAHGFNTLLVQVRGRGDAYYAGSLEPRGHLLARQPATFDPLGTIITEAHRAGVKVHAWVSVNLVASATLLPVGGDHVIHRHPEWLMVPRELSGELRRLDARRPEYVQRLAEWTRRQSTVEGLYQSPLVPASAAYTTRVLGQLVRRYPLDGLHLDYVRYPGPQFDYSRAALDEFRRSVSARLPAPERHRLDVLARRDPFAWVDARQEDWAEFRRARLTALVLRIHHAMKEARPGLLISGAVFPDWPTAFNARFQDWQLWAQRGLLDVVCPMAYTPDAAVFARQVGDTIRTSIPAAVWAGIGAYRLTAADAAGQIRLARSLGADGVVLFSYDAIARDDRDDYLATLKRDAFGAETSPAGVPRKP